MIDQLVLIFITRYDEIEMRKKHEKNQNLPQTICRVKCNTEIGFNF